MGVEGGDGEGSEEVPVVVLELGMQKNMGWSLEGFLGCTGRGKAGSEGGDFQGCFVA